MTLDRDKLAAASKTYRAIFFEQLEKSFGDWRQMAMTVPSTGPSNVYNMLFASPEVQEWIGDRPMEKVKADNYELTNVKYANGLRVLAEDIEDDNLGLYPIKFQEMARNFEKHKEKLAFELLSDGFTATTTYDGQAFYDTDHQDEAETQQDNTGVEVLSASNFEAAYATMMNFTNSKGQPLGVRPTHLAVPPALRATGLKILEQTFLSSGEANINYKTAELIVSPYLKTATEWHLLDLSKGLKPVIYQERTGIQFAMRDRPDDSNVFDQDEFHYGGRQRYALGYGFWQLAYGSTGAGS